jgi:hypothetical protein
MDVDDALGKSLEERFSDDTHEARERDELHPVLLQPLDVGACR